MPDLAPKSSALPQEAVLPINHYSAGENPEKVCKMDVQNQLVIYARFSTDMQNPKSCADQEREIREALARIGIDHSEALVIHDEAESGTKTFRDEFTRLMSMVDRKAIRILAVDDQARLSRADNAFAFITDLVYSGGRFISTGEGIDTIQQGWELRVKVMELHNSTTIRELGRRVRRGQLGRVLAGLSAGDFPFGYEAYYLHPEQLTADHRGPKPEKAIRINETESQWVRWIFDRFIEGWSLGAIARGLNERNASKGRRRRSNWTAQPIRKLLDNTKYIGAWKWGQTTTLRNSKGKTRQQPVPAGQGVTHQRPDLRIIEQAIWEKAQQRLRELNAVFGHKFGLPLSLSIYLSLSISLYLLLFFIGLLTHPRPCSGVQRPRRGRWRWGGEGRGRMQMPITTQ